MSTLLAVRTTIVLTAIGVDYTLKMWKRNFTKQNNRNKTIVILDFKSFVGFCLSKFSFEQGRECFLGKH